tara:strand:- start:421 stop:1701 length:1281 start_codon:yes stop_codon:yes gene_type:complete
MNNKKRTIHVIGINTFKFKDLSASIQSILRTAVNIAAPEIFSNEIKSWISEKKLVGNINFYTSKSIYELIHWIKSNKKDVILLSRGDPLWYGIGRVLLENFPQKELSFHPANTCIQLAFCKLKKSWQDAKIISIHGRDTIELIKSLKSREKKIALLTDPNNKSLDLIKGNLKELNLDRLYEFWLCENIGLENEKFTLIDLGKNHLTEISKLNIVILLRIEKNINNRSLPLFGINDSEFKTFADRPNLITKREIRIQILADLELPEFGALLDIGAGCGTIGLEALRIRPKLKLVCIDKRLGSKNLISENAKRLKVSPLKIIEGDVKQFLNHELKEFCLSSNRVVIGGCDVEKKIAVINHLNKFLNKNDIIVCPIITYEVLQKIILTFKGLKFDTSINMIQNYKGLSIVEGTRLEPNNPVFVIKAKKK